MNRADTVPIATLSGIACLTDISQELSLPAASTSTKDVKLFETQVESNLAGQAVYSNEFPHSHLMKHLENVNTAYLDFKNSSFTCQPPLSLSNQMPMRLQQILQMRPGLFEPKFDTYHGSPLKANNVSALAYSPNQRNAFIQQQMLQQQQLQQQQAATSSRMHSSQSPMDSSMQSPQIPKQQFTPSPSTPNAAVRNLQNFSTPEAIHISHQQQHHQQPYVPMQQMPVLSPQKRVQQNLQQQVLIQQQQQQNLQQNQYNNQQNRQPNQMQHQLHQNQQHTAPTSQQQPFPTASPQQTIPPQQIPSKQDIHSQLAEQKPPPLNHHPQQQLEEAPISQQVPTENDLHMMLSPLKTRGQRNEGLAQPVIQTPTSSTPAQETANNISLDAEAEDESARKSSKKKHKEKHKHKHHKHHDKEKHHHKEKQNHDPIEQNNMTNNGPMLELRVPKLIVRKITVKEGNQERQTMEVYSPEKKKQFTDVITGEDYVRMVEDQVMEPKKATKRARSRRSSKASSIASLESLNHNKKRKKKSRLESSSEEEEADTEVFEQDSKRFRPEDYNEYNDFDGVEVKAEVKKFMFTLKKILDREIELEADGDLDYNEDAEIPPEILLPKPLVSTFCYEVAKMKASDSLNEVPVDQLVRVMSIMDRHVLDTMMLSIFHEEDQEETKQWLSIQSERIVRSAEAAIIILNITTAKNMPKQVYLEEAIEHVAMFCQHHLETIIYPEFDPIYKSADVKDGGYKTKRNYRSSSGAKRKPTLQIYNKLCEVVALLSDLVCLESLTDSIILKISQIGIAPFFVENVNILQLEALKVARTVFRDYVKHRDLILDDILASLARLPTNKRNLRNYSLQDNECIQMFTALVLQLVQCTVQIPNNLLESEDTKSDVLVDKDVLIVKSYEDALRAAQNFMGIFLRKCSSNSRDENDFRPLFENFLHDLFVTANLPEWPAAEVLLTQLGRLFVVTFSNSKLDMTLRSTALDYLAQIATHLRKAHMHSQTDEEKENLKNIVAKLINANEEDEEINVVEDMEVYDEKLRKALVQYLQTCIQQDSSFKYAREFYLGQWIRDAQMEIEKSMIAPMLSIPGAAVASVDDEEEKTKAEVSAEKLQILQEKKDFYHALIKEKAVSTLRSSQRLTQPESLIVVHHLASSRPFSQSFDLYMQQIFKMLSEQAIGLRTKAVKALTQIVSVDSNILAREDVQASVHGRLLDPSTNVREAAVDLIGNFMLKCPELINQYYSMIIDRILDTGVSVRKRVIKILKDICVEQPEFDKIPEICAKMIRRVDDELGIKKLVTEVFRTMWFQPFTNAEKHEKQLYTKALNITKVVALCKDTGFEWLESLLTSLFDPENQQSRQITIKACQQLVNCLVQQILKPELKSSPTTINSCLLTLYLFCKSSPKLLVPHGSTLSPYLTSKINSQNDTIITQNVCKILELIVPLMEHPNPKFLAELEEDSMKLMLKQSQAVVQCSASCLASIINNVTHNFKFIVDAFNKFYNFLLVYKKDYTKNPGHAIHAKKRPTLLRSLFTIGLFCRFFDLDKHIPTESEPTTVEKVFNLILYFTDFKDDEISTKALLSVGFIGLRCPHLLLKEQCRKLYQEILSPSCTSIKTKFIILKNLQYHLMEDEQRLQKAAVKSPAKRRKPKNDESEEGIGERKNIKEMGDVLSGNTSEIVQVLLTDIMKCFLHSEKQIRTSSLQVVSIILRQGLVHPVQCIPYLIAISTDSERLCHIKAEQCLNDLDSRYQGFIHMKAFQGVKMSYELQSIIQKNEEGYYVGYRENENKIALLNHVYGMIARNKQYRRPYVLSVIKQFDDKTSTVGLLYFLTENMAYTTYNTQEEPLFIIHHIDTIASVSGANSLQSFKELFSKPKKSGKTSPSSDSDDEEDINEQQLSQDDSLDTKKLEDVVHRSFGCCLLLELKSYLKLLYGFTDAKCQKYSPSEPSKLYDKAINRRTNEDFLSSFKDIMFAEALEKDAMLDYYVQFRQMMLSLDTEDDESDSEENIKIKPEEEATPSVHHQEKENAPADKTSHAQHNNSSLPIRENQLSSSSAHNTNIDIPKTKTPGGIVPQVKESASLPGLTVNMNIPIIPLKLLEPNISTQKPKKKHRTPSRRSSRSSRCSVNTDD